MYPGKDGYNFDYDYPRGQEKHIIDKAAHPRLSQKEGPEFDVAHHDMYPGKDGYNFDYDYPRGQEKHIIDKAAKPRLA